MHQGPKPRNRLSAATSPPTTTADPSLPIGCFYYDLITEKKSILCFLNLKMALPLFSYPSLPCCSTYVSDFHGLWQQPIMFHFTLPDPINLLPNPCDGQDLTLTSMVVRLHRWVPANQPSVEHWSISTSCRLTSTLTTPLQDRRSQVRRLREDPGGHSHSHWSLIMFYFTCLA